MNKFKELCIQLRKQDYTLSEIMKVTGRSKTSVYFHIKNILLSERKKKEIREASSFRAKKISSQRKGRSTRQFKKFATWDTNTVSLVSHLIFDGELKYSGCVYNNRNDSLIKHVQKSMESIYKYPPTRYQNPLTEVFRISYFNVALVAYIRTKAEELVEKIQSMPIHLKRTFLKAFFDDEGCMDYRPKRNLRQIRGYQKNTALLKLVQCLLKDFNISSSIILPNEVVIVGKKDLTQFQKEIDFSAGVYINGNRSNSLWKKSLEKRVILKMALESYSNQTLKIHPSSAVAKSTLPRRDS